MRLYIAEKPSVAQAIANELGSRGKREGHFDCGDSLVTWCRGHMLELLKPDAYLGSDVPTQSNGNKLWRAEDLPIIPGEWLSMPQEDSKQQLAVIGRLLKTATEVVHAGDPDREGQLIVDAVLKWFKSTLPVLRYWVSAIDAVSVQRGLASLKDNHAYRGWGHAAEQRSRADWLIGMNLSRAYTLRARRGGSQVLLTIGRVQTPTLALVVQRDRTIASFKPVNFHALKASFSHVNGPFTARWNPAEDQVGIDPEGRLVDTAVADAVAKKVSGQSGSIRSHEQELKEEKHPRAFSLSCLTLLASNTYGYKATDVLSICQALYETHKLTSYPRTDCPFLPESQHADAPRVLAALKKVNPHLAKHVDLADATIKSATWNDKRITAHHGIIPTMHEGSLASLSAEERNVYGLIVRSYLAQFFPLHEFLRTKIEVVVAGESFSASGKVVVKAGWKALYGAEASEQSTDDDPAEDQAQNLPSIRNEDEVSCIACERIDRKTKAPPHYTDATLGNAMAQIHLHVQDPAHRKMLRESDGMGTEATRAAIVADLGRRGYVETKGKFLVHTKLGGGLIDAVPEIIRSPLLTALYERMLKEIEGGHGDVGGFQARQEKLIREEVARANDGALRIAGGGTSPCPKCSKDMRRIKGENGFFWSCIDREACKHTMDDKAGKPLARQAAVISDVHRCTACGKGLVRRKGVKKARQKTARDWWGCSGFPACKLIYGDSGGKPDFAQSRTPSAQDGAAI
jgi:DNA topoisomerase-3